MPRRNEGPWPVLGLVERSVRRALEAPSRPLLVREVGSVLEVGQGIARVDGLAGVQSEELVQFAGGRIGVAFNLDPDEVGVILFDDGAGIEAGSEVRRSGRVMDVPVGESMLGRVLDPTGRALDGRGGTRATGRLPIEREAPAIMQRQPVRVPLHTGIKVIDALVPIGRGQRELILGDRQTGKTAIAVDTILHQASEDVICVYCAIGQRSSALARTIDELGRRGAMAYTTVIATTGEDPAGLQLIAPYAATSVAEWFMEQGRDVLIVYDDLTQHARVYRQLSLLLRRPPGREAYPGDIFYLHSRLLERSTNLRSAGSLTALPIAETQGEDISAYIPTNLVSITDGQIFLSPRLFRQGVLPAVDVGRSVSRVGGKAQLAAYRAVAGHLRLSYAQFQELERFGRYGARLAEEQRRALAHGRRVREVLRQPTLDTMPVSEQIIVLFAAVEGLFDQVPVESVGRAEESVRSLASGELKGLLEDLASGRSLEDADRESMRSLAEKAIGPLADLENHGIH